ncbi:MAG: hypothetical protein JO112_15640, partial [Planctomycetes bacterium]|nr:hypothetical protein [Planctomycetota bacterium]
MNPRELFLLSAYRLPTQNSLTLSHEDVTAFLNGYAALWHPAALRGANGPPRIASQYDHELPTAGHVYACPETPPLFLPEDWEQRVRDAGSIAFRSTPDREETVNNLLEALRASGGEVPEAGRPALEQAGPFLGLGFGYVQLETLFAAMEHENMLAAAEFWGEVQQALAALDQADLDGCRRSLEAAAGRLLTAREVLYPVTIHLIDLGLLDEDRPGNSLPLALDRGFACNLIASGSTLEKLAHDNPERWTTLRERVQAGQAEVCGGCYVEREDALLPIESQLWNLRKGLAVARDLLGEDLRVFARRRHAFHPQWPVVLTSAGLQRMVLLAFDDAVLPSYRSTVVGWLAPDGRPVEAFTRAPYRADNPLTFFNLAHYLHQTIMQDHAATLALLHAGTPAAPWYQDWLELSRLAPVLGSWTTLTRYLNEVPAGEHLPAPSADEFHDDALAEHTPTHPEQPVSWVARHVRRRRRLDTIWTLAALHRGLAGRNDSVILDARLADLEDGLETGRDVDKELAELQIGR